MVDEAIAVFTARSPQRILREGGSQAWTLNAPRARRTKYLICVQNQNHRDRDFSDAARPHGSVILIGKISDVIPAPENPDGSRWMICFDEFAYLQPQIDPADVWQGWRNPVRYTTLAEMGVTLDGLVWEDAETFSDEQPSPQPEISSKASTTMDNRRILPLNIAQAKESLAAFYDLEPDAIDILIRS